MFAALLDDEFGASGVDRFDCRLWEVATDTVLAVDPLGRREVVELPATVEMLTTSSRHCRVPSPASPRRHSQDRYLGVPGGS
jgi:hypothetical protein